MAHHSPEREPDDAASQRCCPSGVGRNEYDWLARFRDALAARGIKANVAGRWTLESPSQRFPWPALPELMEQAFRALYQGLLDLSPTDDYLPDHLVDYLLRAHNCSWAPAIWAVHLFVEVGALEVAGLRPKIEVLDGRGVARQNSRGMWIGDDGYPISKPNDPFELPAGPVEWDVCYLRVNHQVLKVVGETIAEHVGISAVQVPTSSFLKSPASVDASDSAGAECSSKHRMTLDQIATIIRHVRCTSFSKSTLRSHGVLGPAVIASRGGPGKKSLWNYEAEKPRIEARYDIEMPDLTSAWKILSHPR